MIAVTTSKTILSLMKYTLRPDLEPLPERMMDLPIDKRGYVVPWFVEWIEVDGERVPEFRAMSAVKLVRAVKEKACWVCGKRLGTYMAFVIGPMCGINRVSSEPPSHLECGQWSARNCPFMARPHMGRRELDAPELHSAGFMIRRNPGVMMLWVTRGYKTFQANGVLFKIGEPEHVEWWREGRAATRAEVEESVATGLPALIEAAHHPGEDVEANLREIEERRVILARMYPEA